MTKKAENVFTTPVGEVVNYTLDAPFGQKTPEFDSTGKLVEGKFSIGILLDPEDAATEELLTELKGNRSIQEVTINKKPYVKVTASTKFKPTVANADGEEIDAPTDVRPYWGDVVKAVLNISAYTYKIPGKGESSAIRLNVAQILSHDTSKRETPETTTSTTSTAKQEFFDSIKKTTDNLAQMKG